jgi:tetratricopeptide (TPR) repeat protein
MAQDVEAMVKEANRLEDIPNEMAAYNKLKEVLMAKPNHLYALSKASELCSRIGTRETLASNRDKWYAQALLYANRAITVSPRNDNALVSMAMILGKASLTKSGKEKLKSAREIKRCVDVALQTNPNNYLAWHILGRWNYEISNISTFERAGAKLFYGGVPDGSLKNAIMYFEKSKTLMPLFILNYVELAKAYHKDGQKQKAIGLLKTLQAFPINTEDDAQHKLDAQWMMKNWE